MLHLRASAVVVVVVLTGCPPAVEPPPPPPPEAECALDLNFDSSGAEPAVVGAAVAGILCPAFDRDYFSVDVAADGTIIVLTLSMATAVTAVSPAYKIVKDDGTLEGLATPFAGEDPSESREAVSYTASHRLDVAGRYYVVVQDVRFVDDAFDITNAYSLTVNLVADPDASEPNNTDDAATLQSPGTFSGQIATTGDEDWYAIDVPAGAQIVDVTVSARADSGVDHVASLFAADGLTELLAAPLTEGLTVGTLETRLRARANGGERAFLVVRDANGLQSQLDATIGTYTVVLAVIANPDLNEGDLGNDDEIRGTPITSGNQLSGALATTADQDLYRIAAGAGTTRANPSVLLLTLEFDGVIDESFQPQVLVRGVDPELPAGQQGCGSACAEGDCDGNKCKAARLARFVDGASFRTAFPLRDSESVIVVVNEFGDDTFQAAGGYSIRAEIVDDPDPGEAGDDFLIPNLEFAGFANNADLARQYDASRARARVLATNYPPRCDDDDLPAGCLPVIAVPEPIPGLDPEKTFAVDCSAAGAEPVSLTATGRLTYEGDRDYFRIDLPAQAYFALNFSYDATGPGNTPLELALFVHNASGAVISNTLEATQTGSNCLSALECDAGSICVDRNCWTESDSNPTFNDHAFPGVDGECSFISPFDEPPYFLEVVDNGINDFDTDLNYSFTVDVLCGCPDACEVGGGLTTRCQGVVDPT